MLLAHGTRLGTSPLRYIAGVVTIDVGYTHERGQWGRTGASRNWFVGEATSGTAPKKGAVPSGCLPPTSWVLPQKAGGLASRGLITGTGTAAGNLAGGKNAEATLTGSGVITSAEGSLVMYALATLTGSGTLSSADLTALGELAAALSGVGTLEGEGLLAQVIEAFATLTGTGTLTGALGAEAGLEATLTGTGTVSSAEPYATGDMSATLTLVEAGTLTASGIASAVWTQAIEAGYTAEEVLRVMTAALAGKVSGAATGTIRFRDLADTKDRLVATTDSSGNRTSITRDAT